MVTIVSFKEKMGSIKAVIFDLDGTLIDSIPAYFEVMASILGAVGLPPAPRPMVAEFMTQGLPALEKMIPAEMEARKDELIEQFLDLGRSKLKNVLQEEVDLIPGVNRLFATLAHRKILIGVASSTLRAYIDFKLTPFVRNNLRESLLSVIATEDAPRKKPAPDPLIVCAQELGVPTKNCVYVGDSDVDIQAGRAAGMMTIGVLTGLHDRDTLERENPTIILDSVANLVPLFD